MTPEDTIEAERALQAENPDWRARFGVPLRNHLRNRLVELVSPGGNLELLDDGLIEELFLVMTAVEARSFEDSYTPDRYYWFMARNVVYIKKIYFEN